MKILKTLLVLGTAVLLGLAPGTITRGQFSEEEQRVRAAQGFERFKRDLQATQEHFRKMYRGDVKHGILFVARTDSYRRATSKSTKMFVRFFAGHVCKEDDELLLQRIELVNLARFIHQVDKKRMRSV